MTVMQRKSDVLSLSSESATKKLLFTKSSPITAGSAPHLLVCVLSLLCASWGGASVGGLRSAFADDSQARYERFLQMQNRYARPRPDNADKARSQAAERMIRGNTWFVKPIPPPPKRTYRNPPEHYEEFRNPPVSQQVERQMRQANQLVRNPKPKAREKAFPPLPPRYDLSRYSLRNLPDRSPPDDPSIYKQHSFTSQRVRELSRYQPPKRMPNEADAARRAAQLANPNRFSNTPQDLQGFRKARDSYRSR
jgi:hypothetical protein